MILKEYNLSVRLPQERAIDTGITLVQNDKDVYKLNVRIFDGVNEIDYSEVDSATITFLKRDNNVVQGNMTVEADQLSYTLGTNEIACPGKVLVSIQLFGSTERLSTARFVMSVERDLVTAEAVQSTSEFPILQKLVADVEQLKQDIVNLQIPDNSILDVKLSDAAGQIKSQVNAHLAESASKHITESGSNANGEYIKFDDGTQICWAGGVSVNLATISIGIYATIPMPSAFLDSTKCAVSFGSGQNLATLAMREPFKNMFVRARESNTWQLLGDTTYDGELKINFLAIGRWK